MSPTLLPGLVLAAQAPGELAPDDHFVLGDLTAEREYRSAFTEA